MMKNEDNRFPLKLEEESAEKRLQATLTSELLFAFKEGNIPLSLNAVERCIKIGLPHYISDELREWKYFLVHILSLLSIVVIRTGRNGTYPNALARDYLVRIDQAKTLEECHDLFRDMVETLGLENEKARVRYPVQVVRIMECIAMDLKQPLTLQYFASLLNVNSSYLSNLFHKHTGVTITEYVTKTRMEHAATLLGYTQDSIRTIAENIGIPDVQYFSRLFKRKYGLTPTQYREKCMDNLIFPGHPPTEGKTT